MNLTVLNFKQMIHLYVVQFDVTVTCTLQPLGGALCIVGPLWDAEGL